LCCVAKDIDAFTSVLVAVLRIYSLFPYSPLLASPVIQDYLLLSKAYQQSRVHRELEVRARERSGAFWVCERTEGAELVQD